MTLNIKLILDVLDFHFVEMEVRMDRRFGVQDALCGRRSLLGQAASGLPTATTTSTAAPPSTSPAAAITATSEKIPVAQLDMMVVADNWGGMFDAEVVADDWGGLFEQPAHQLTIPVAANLDRIRRLSRPCDVADRGLLCDLLWSDPSSMEDREWADNKDRSVSCTFGTDVAADCRRAQDLDIMCRAHQVVEDGYEFSADRQLVTFFSAPNYRQLGCSFTIIKPKMDSSSSSPLGCSTKCLGHAASTPMNLSMPDAVPTQYPTSSPHVFTISNHDISRKY